MAKILFVNPGSAGHVNPTIAVVKELVNRGEEVVYYASDIYKDKLKDTGAEIRTLPTEAIMTAFTDHENHHLFNVINGLLKTVDIIVPQILRETENEHFDYMIHDSMFSCGYILAQILNLPSISSVSSFAHTKTSFETFINHLTSTVSKQEIQHADETFNTLKAHVESTYDVTIPSRFEVMNNPGNINIAYVMKGFQVGYDAFDPEYYKFVGPSILEPKDSGFMDHIDTTRPVVYISLGTVFNQNIEFFNLCFEAFADIDASFVVSIGHDNQLEDFNAIPSNFTVAHVVPQTELLQHTTLFLTHAGMNSTNEAMLMEVPMLAFPQSADQPVVARQIEKLLVGRQLQLENITAHDLKQIVLNMLDEIPSYQRNIRKVKSIQSSNKTGYQLAVDHILNFRNQYVTHSKI